MIDGPGDPDIFQHDRIETELADAWRTIPLPFTLQPETSQLAARFGYTIPKPDRPAVQSPAGLSADAQVLEHVDELSNEEVEAALKALLPLRERDS